MNLVLGTTSWPRIAPHAESIRQVVEHLPIGSFREYPLP